METIIVISVIALWFCIYAYRRGKRAKEKVVSINNEKCIRCRQCIKACSHQVLEIVNNKDGLNVVVTSPEKCTACRKCIKSCKFGALKLTNRAKSQTK